MLEKFLKYLPDPLPPPPKILPDQGSKTGRFSLPETRGIEYNGSSYTRRVAGGPSLGLGQHWGIVGSTGSGKTYFAMRGLLEFLRVYHPHAKRYILDSTDDPDMERMVHAPLVVRGDTPPDLLWRPTYTQIWKPDHSILPDQYATWLYRLNDSHQPQIVVIDELASLVKHAMGALEVLLKQSRKHGCTVICLTQQISNIDSTTLFSQMTHYAQFSMGFERYDKSMSRRYLAAGEDDRLDPRYQFGFFYRNVRSRLPYQEYRDVQDFFRTSLHIRG